MTKDNRQQTTDKRLVVTTTKVNRLAGTTTEVTIPVGTMEVRLRTKPMSDG